MAKSIYDRLPRFAVVEPNNLKGLQAGFVVAQCDHIAEDIKTDKDGDKFVENGKLCMMVKGSGSGDTYVEAKAWAAEPGANPVMYITYTEPLLTLINEEDTFAVDLENELPRFVQLIPGDEWMTDMAYSLSGELAKHVIEVKEKEGWNSVKTLANGKVGHHYVYLG